MKFFKQISLISAFALLITIGGVYATWNYAQGTIEAIEDNLALTVADVVLTDAKGTLDVTNNVEVVIDQTNAGDYKAKLVMTGDINIAFTPDANATADVLQNGVALQYTLTENAGNYGDVDIISVTSTPIVLNNGVAAKNFTISANDLTNNITLGEFSLPTYEDYQEFVELIAGKKITVTVSEYAG